MTMTRMTAGFSAVLLVIMAALAGCTSSGSTGSDTGTAHAKAGKFDGTYVMEFGKMRSADSGQEVPGSTPLTEIAVVRSACPDGCSATAVVVNPAPNMASNFVLDYVDGSWLLVRGSPVTCGEQTTEEFRTLTLTAGHDGGFTGLYRSLTTANNGCNFDREVTVKRIGDVDPGVHLADPSILADRVVNRASGFHGRYKFVLTDKAGDAQPPLERKVQTYCERTGDRCVALLTAENRELIWALGDGTWNFATTVPQTCPDKRPTTHKDTATFALPESSENPIAKVAGTLTRVVAEPCPSTTEYTVTGERIGD